MIITKRIISALKIILTYFVLNIRRYIAEKKLQKITNNDLFNNGFVKFNNDNGKKLAKYLEEIIKDPGSCESSKLGNFKINYKDSFGIKSIIIDSSSEFLHEYVFTEEILKKLKNFYGKEFYLRNNPTIEFSYNINEKNDSQKFHLDWGLKQTSVMINLNEITEDLTHMEYIKKSNKQYKFMGPSRISKREIINSEKNYKNLETVKTTGEIGQTSIFDAGCGYHRQVSGGKRVILHLNFTENLVYTRWNKQWNPAKPIYWFTSTDEKKSQNLEGSIFNLVNRNFTSKFMVPNIYLRNR